MILCVDIGNTSIKVGLYSEETIKFSFTLKLKKDSSSYQYQMDIKELLPKDVSVKGCIISSVVPSVTNEFKEGIDRVFGINSLILNKNLKTKMPIKIDNPSELGSDILAGAIGGKKKYGYPFVVADLGTATKLYVVNKEGAFIGVIIGSGMQTSLNGLVGNAALLYEIPFELPSKIIGKNTKDSLESGIIYSQYYFINGIATDIEKEVGYPLKKILTGGYSNVLKNKLSDFSYDENLVLDGLYEIYKINSKGI